MAHDHYFVVVASVVITACATLVREVHDEKHHHGVPCVTPYPSMPLIACMHSSLRGLSLICASRLPLACWGGSVGMSKLVAYCPEFCPVLPAGHLVQGARASVIGKWSITGQCSAQDATMCAHGVSTACLQDAHATSPSACSTA